MAVEVKASEPVPGALPEPPQAPLPSTSGRLAASAFGLYVLAALPIVVLGLGRYHWFLGDDWDFLSDRQAGSVGDLMRPHAEHWSTVPVLLSRIEWNLFGFHYRAYQAVTMILHLAAAVLLRVVMRRAGVHPWIATAAAAIFVLFGPGDQNMLWSFQIGMVGTLVFGLLHLILADHDGRWRRSDWLGLGAGLLGLMSSGIGPIMVAVVGVAVLIRRGWRMAAFHTVPLGVIFLGWFVAYRDQQPESRGHVGPRALWDWLYQAALGLFGGLGYYPVVAAALAVVLVVGLAVAWVPLISSRCWTLLRRQASLPVALMAGAVAFHFVTANSRWSFGSGVARSSRYIHVGALFVLPALAVAGHGLARRWRTALPLVVILFLIPVPFNLRWFDPDKTFFNEPYHRHRRLQVEGIAWSDEAEEVSPSQRPVRDVLGGEGPSVGWLLEGRRDGRIPDPGPLSRSLQQEIRIRLGVAQSGSIADDQAAEGRRCRTYRGALELAPQRGDTFVFLDPIAVGLQGAGRGPRLGISYTPFAGQDLRIALDGLQLRLQPAPPAKTFRLCS
ncbi:MAG: hypothetical protein WKF43_00005 [Acidimicrobiales bacterium]